MTKSRSRWAIMAVQSGVLLVAAIAFAGVAAAEIASDKAAALLVYPVVQFSSHDGLNTTIQISNTSRNTVAVRCFYVNANGHCSSTGDTCFSGSECSGGLCVPGWEETDFKLYLTPEQPLAWVASEGLSRFPLDGVLRSGPNRESNAGSRVPPVSEDPFVGELKCVVVDDQDRPSDSNALVGSETLVQTLPDFVDSTRSEAVGIQAIPGANNGDNTLRLGEEYEPCPGTLIMNHFFDDAIDPITGERVLGALAIVPCSEDFVVQDQNLTQITLQFLVFNEFEQRFSTSQRIQCYALFRLSNIDTSQAKHSIFDVAVAGTLTGQTRIRGVGANGHGIVGDYFDLHGRRSSASVLHFQGGNPDVDVIRIP